MGKIKDITSKLWKNSKLPLKISSLALPILLSTGNIKAYEHTPENIKKYAMQIVTDKQGYKHWEINGVWYSNKPIEIKELISKEISVQTSLPDSFNTYIQPNDTSLIWYASGDIDENCKISNSDLESLLQIPYGTKTDTGSLKYDRADINGDRIIDNSDKEEFEKYLNRQAKYLASYWNKIQENNERISWLEKMIQVDKTDTLKYVTGEWMCANFSKQTSINFHGYPELNNPDIAKLFPKYNIKENGRFNIPVYYVTLASPTIAHAINACLIGDNPLDFNDWYFFEPQNNQRVFPGDWSMPENCFDISVKYVIFNEDHSTDEISMVKFKLNGTTPELIYQLYRLVLHRPNQFNAPKDFELLSPANKSVMPSSEILFSWNKSKDDIGDIVNYALFLGTDSLFSDAKKVETNSDTSLALSDLESGKYFWKVMAYDMDSLATWGSKSNLNPWKFVLRPISPPKDFELLSPANKSVMPSGEILFSWNKSKDDIGDIVKYALFLGKDSLFSDAKKVETNSDTSLALSDLESGKYFWKVMAYDLDSLATWGSKSNLNPWKFEIKYTNIAGDSKIPKKYSLSANYPNPFNQTTTIQYQLPKSSDVTLAVYDLTGRLIQTLINESKPAGYYSIIWNADQVSSGLYIYEFKAENFRSVKKCLVVK